MKTKAKWAILWGIIILFALMVVGLRGCLAPKPYNKDEWKQTYAEKAESKVDVDFKELKTTKETYDAMHEALEYYANDKYGANLDDLEKQYKSLDNDTNVIYFTDSMLIRFKDKNNKDTKLTAQFVDGEAKISNYLSVVYEKRNSNYKTELEYIEKVASSIMKLAKATTEDELNTAEDRAVSYFTFEAKEKLLNSKEALGITDSTISNLAVNYIDIGKSDLSLGYNRLYIQLDLGDKKTDIIAKLNKYNKIYDFDIIGQ